jgi:methyl-accepting chemotaxis protein
VLTYVTAGKYRSILLSKGVSVGESFRGDVEKALGLGIPLSYMEDLDQRLGALLQEDATLAFAMVADSAGKVLFHTDEARKGTEFDGELEDISLEEPLIREKKSTYEIILPLLDAEGRQAGIVVLGIKARAIKDQILGLLKWAVVIVGVSFLIFLGLVSFIVTRFIARPIMETEKVASEIASGDLTKQVTTRGGDEIAVLGKSINLMAGNIKAIITEIQDSTTRVSNVSEGIAISSDRMLDISDTQQRAVSDTAASIDEMKMSVSSIGDSAKSLTESAENASSAVSEMTMSISRVAENSDSFSQLSDNAASSIEEMIASIREIASGIESLSASSGEIATALLQVNATINEIQQSADKSVQFADTVSTEASEKGMKAAETAMEGMQSIKKSVGTLSEVINKLGTHSEAIGSVVNVIDEVTDQTTLLSLNAAILAAQAGEHGSGFAVVASEIKDLADRTSMSTNEITELISNVQGEVRNSVQMAAEGLKSVEGGIKLVSEVSAALKSIQNSSQASTEMAKTIQRATTEEARAIQQITEATNNMNKQLSHISNATQEQSKGGKLILEAVENIRVGSSHIKNATHEQIEGSKQIDKMAGKVHSLSEQIEGAISEQQGRSDDVVRSIGSINETAEALIVAANEMRRTAAIMQEDSEKLASEIKRFVI